MKIVSFLIATLMLFSTGIVIAQKCLPENVEVKNHTTTLATAPDFTITTTDGVQRNLYTTLNNNKSVLLDFFFVGCGYCQTYAPIIDEAYVRYGSGSGNIEFWGISDRDNNSAINTYKSTYGVTNPCAGTNGNGASVTSVFQSSFNWTGWPTYSVVCKNKTIYWDVNYPPTSTGFDTYFSNCGSSWGIEEYDSSTPSIQAIYPVPATTVVSIAFYLPARSETIFDFYDIRGLKLASYEIFAEQGLNSFELPVGDLDNGNYFFTWTVNGRKAGTQKLVILR